MLDTVLLKSDIDIFLIHFCLNGDILYYSVIKYLLKCDFFLFVHFLNFKLDSVSQQEAISPLENIFFYYFDRQQQYTHTIKAL